MMPDVGTPRDTTLAEHFAALITRHAQGKRYRMRGAIRLLGHALGREATLADLAAGDAEQLLEGFMRRRLYCRSTTAGYVEALKKLRRADRKDAGQPGR